MDESTSQPIKPRGKLGYRATTFSDLHTGACWLADYSRTRGILNRRV